MDYDTWKNLPSVLKCLDQLVNGENSSITLLSKVFRFCFEEGKKYGKDELSTHVNK